jgi:hypothetical protein
MHAIARLTDTADNEPGAVQAGGPSGRGSSFAEIHGLVFPMAMTRRCWVWLLPALLASGITSAAGQSLIPVQDRRPPDPPRAEPGSGRPRPTPFGPWRPQGRRGRYQEPAFARGYADGYKRGVDDNRDRNRYDPVGHGDYRRGDEGYYRDYGSRDAYKNNYRAGYRQGYEDGYRSRGQRS